MTDKPTHTPLPCPWKVGDKVQRKPGASYLFPGVIISTGLKLDGKTWHCEVECIAPGVEGCTHVFPASQLVPLDPAWNTRAVNSHHDLIEALRDVINHFKRDGWNGSAPGHAHISPGVWDDDISNGERAGQPCDWCAKWERARAILTKAEAGHG